MEPSTGPEAEHRRLQRRWFRAGMILFATAWSARLLSGLDGLQVLLVGYWLLLPVSVVLFAIGGWRRLRGPDPHPFFVRGR